MPFGPCGGRIGVELGRELRAIELERLELGIDRLVERGRGLAARFGQGIGGLAIRRRRPAGRRLQRLELVLAGIDQGDVGIVFARELREFIDRDIVFARRCAQREQPLLDALELGRIEIGCAQAQPQAARASRPAR